jgi:hypothetical protein
MSEKLLIQDGVKYSLWVPENEPADFEPMIKYHIKDIFGEEARYFPKQKLRTIANNNSIPDGFVIDFKNQRWFVVELKLLCDDAVRRISGQIVDYKNAMKNPHTRQQIFKSIYDEINKAEMHPMLYDLITNKNPHIVVLIDCLEGELGAQFKEKVEGVDSNVRILTFKTFAKDGVDPKRIHVHLLEPLSMYGLPMNVPPVNISTVHPRVMLTEKVSISGERQRARKGEKTPQENFIVPILGVLIELGGRGKTGDVIDLVGKKLGDLLTEVDYQKVPSGGDIRWRNTAMFARNDMKANGLLASSEQSGWGIWEITDKGRKYYEEK